jgi:hypothetical protein|tara:strand:- start:248 stop:601 length:354 start_codon:yes stop_codon:yes gene_type:complete
LSGLNNLGYFAGILDGEGSFFLETNKKEKRYVYIYPVISCEMTDFDVIESLEKFFKVGHITKFQPRKKHYKISWRWRVRGGKAIDILKLCIKYFSIRRKEKANILIEHWKNRRNNVV